MGKGALGQTRPPTPPAGKGRPWDVQRLRDLGAGVKDILQKAQESGNPLQLTPHLRKRLIGIGTALQNAVLLLDANRGSEIKYTMHELENPVAMADLDLREHCFLNQLAPFTLIAEHVEADRILKADWQLTDVDDGLRRGGIEFDDHVFHSDANISDDGSTGSHADFELDQVSDRSWARE